VAAVATAADIAKLQQTAGGTLEEGLDMMAWTGARAFAVGVSVLSLLVGCGVDASSSVGVGSFSAGGSSSSGGASSSGGSPSGPTQPMLVVVDTNRTMSASPGEGVGVFTQYATGGHWNVWWTCDTSKTGLPCAFDVTVSVTSGTIANVTGQSRATTDGVTSTSQSLEATTTTTTGVDGVTFDTVVASGATPIITLDAKVGGVEDGSYLFFVQDGVINGNYPGSLTDPLMLEPLSP
jgi:hypothetical protein